MMIRQSLSNDAILRARPAKNVVDLDRPYAFLAEKECQPNGQIDDVAVLFLTNRECPYRCLMCDLWKNTTDITVPVGSVPAQINHALRNLPPTNHIKLYNSGNFFDPLAIPVDDYAAIASLVKDFETVVVENHPRMCGQRVPAFLDILKSENAAITLEVAIGLETVHPAALSFLNKQMTTQDFRRACDYLGSLGVAMRAFVLLRPPTLSEDEGREWAPRSIEFAFDCGVKTVSIIPTRGGNGVMEQLSQEGLFSPPSLESLETVMAWGLSLGRGRVFADLWDGDRWRVNEIDWAARVERLRQMNLRQQLLPNP